MVSIKSKYLTCEDCKWNFLCSSEERSKRRKKCVEFELDVIMSDKYVDRLINRNKKTFIEQLHEIYLENNDV